MSALFASTPQVSDDCLTVLPDLLFARAAVDQELLLRIAPISRAFHQVAQDCWGMRQKAYKEGLKSKPAGTKVQRSTGTPRPCAGCKRPTTIIYPFGDRLRACHECTSSTGPRHLRLMSHSACKDTFLLTDNDLYGCPVLHARHRSYGNEIRVYRRQDVLEIALDKHGGPQGLNTALDAREKKRMDRGKPSEHRAEIAERLVTDADPHALYNRQTLYEVCCSDYVRNGSGGQRGVKERISRFMRFEMVSPPCSGELVLSLSNARRDYVQSGEDRYLDVAIKASELCESLGDRIVVARRRDFEPFLYGQDSLHYIRRHMLAPTARAKELADALSLRKLELRADSRLCNAYIESGVGDIDEIVDVMDEMRFYHAHTNYPYEVQFTSSQEAKNRALNNWVAGGGRLDDPDLPLSLKKTVSKRIRKQQRSSNS
jgi:hypothetical protein